MAGPGELFTGCERIFDPIAILDSQTSGLCDELDKAAEPVTTQANSVVAFQAAFEDLGLNPHTITGPELAAGWLRQNGTRLLAMPGVCSLSDAEIAAVRDFAAAGGTVVADVRPGARLPNGNPRSAVALDEVFGIAYDAAAAARRVRGAIAPVPGLAGAPAVTVAEALADPRVKAATAKAAARLGDTPVLLANRCAQGQAFLLNASFASYASGRIEGGSAWRPWYDAMRWVTESAGLRRAFTLTSNDQETPGFELSPFRNGQGYLLGVEDLGCGDHIGPRRPFRIGLPGRFQVFEVRSGRSLGATEAIAEDIPRNGHRAYFLAPYGRPDLTLRAAATRVRPGETLQLNLDLRPEGGSRCLHVVRVEARTPDGESFWPFRRVLRLPPTGPAAVALTVARNDPRGAWTFSVTDVNTGTRTELGITVE
jgi:hypothetical protein